MKKLFSFFVLVLIVVGSVSCKQKSSKNAKAPQLPLPQKQNDFTKEFLFDSQNAVKDSGSKEFSTITVFELTDAMGAGWNLGNTFDATGAYWMESETSWGQPKTTKEMIDGLAASGIKTIRIPVSWHNHITDKDTYTIEKNWMARVKTVVDWAIDAGLYVIINSHHDNYSNEGKMPAASGYYPNSTNLVESQKFLYNVWGQIGTAFNNGYDEHLIFETMNEPRPAGTDCEWWYSSDARCIDSMQCLNKMNQTALDAIRATGGNNKKRFVMCPSLQASENAANSSLFKMPLDVESGRLILSVHAYTPYSFAMENPGERTFTQAHKDELKALFLNLKNRFITNGYGVVIGEYGATNKDNLADRVAWFDYFVSSANNYGIPCILWDNGVWWISYDSEGVPNYSEGYGYYNRLAQTWYFPEIAETIINSSK